VDSYSLLSRLYDYSVKENFCNYRGQTVKALGLEPGNVVVDIACGTGLNFEHILEAIGPQGTLIGVDFSTAMLARAQDKIDANGWQNVHLLHKDASEVSQADLDSLTGQSGLQADAVLCTLGLCVIPGWEEAFNRSYDLLRKDGRYAIMDVYYTYNSLLARLNDLLAGSDVSRRSWEPLQQTSADYSEDRYPIEKFPFIVRMGPVAMSEAYAFVASGRKQ